jgi:translation initiation factor IF-2
MSELKLPRLLAAAKEFNVGQETINEFLIKKGLTKESLKVNDKLSEDMYYAAQAEFSSDKAAKTKADQVEIPKGAAAEQRKKKDEQEISFASAKPVVKEEPKPAVVEEVKPVVVEQVQAPVVETPKEEIKIAQPAPQPEPVIIEDSGVIKIEAPEIEGPKIVNKIDLSAIDSSTRPKKSVKTIVPPAEEIKEKKPELKVEKPVEKKKPAVQIKKKEETPTSIVVETPAPEVAPAQDAVPVVENIEVEKLTGPKILGKIELPVDSDTRPKPVERNNDEKRKRKRIPVDKRGGPNTQQPNQGGQQQGGGGFNRGPQQGGGGGFNRGGQQGGGGGFNRGPQQGGGGGGFNRGGQQGGGGFNRGGNRPGSRDVRPTIRPADKEIDAKEIQDKIKETQAKLAGSSGRGKSLKAKYRRAKREEAAEVGGNEMDGNNKLQVTEFVTVSELANLMDVSFAEVISKCMSLGIMVSINQRLDAEVIELVVSEFNFEVEFIGIDDAEEIDEEEEMDDAANLTGRPPIVTIMGHVDHGKTSLLDYIRRANVVAGEAGGITQHIGAYEVTLPTGKNITFLDTPGHEAFTAMRARGAKVTDIAVIVVAADDAVMPQTKEAISHAQAAGVPMIFAVNKIDKDGANPQKIYEQLSQMNLLVESWGGKYQSQELSARKGEKVDELLEKILLEAELLDLKANPQKEATGTIIEASLDKGRGYVATILVQNGTLKQGDLIVSGQYFGRIKAMFNERNQRVEVAPPSTPVVILGLNGAPQAGEKFKVFDDESEAKETATKRAQILREQGLRARKHITLDEIGRRLALGNFKELNIIIKGDVDGSVEALSDSLQKLSTAEVAIRVVHKAVGQISESDVLLATASDAILIGFNVRPSSQANKLAETEGVQIKMYSIIYNAIEEIKSAMEGMLEPKVEEKEVATVEIREVFKFDKVTIAGCYVTEGKIKREHKVKLFRDGILIYPRQEGGYAELGSLKRFKDDVKEVASNYECGLTIKNFSDIQAGDTVVAYEEEEVKRTL